MLRGIVSALLLACLLSGCGRPDDPVFRDRFYALGTLIDLSLYGANPEQQLEASEALAAAFNTMHADWHAWEAGRLAQTNTLLAGGRPFRPEADILALLQAANRLSLQSGGLFNPTIGKLIDLWGFHADEITALTPPDPTAVQDLLALAPSAADVVLEDGQVVSRNPAVQYDLGAFAKGYAIDRGIELLQSLGIAHAIINAGGDLRAIGRHGDRPWRIGIRHPRQAGVLASVELSEDESIFTSGDYERYFEASGQRYHHIIDPRTGYPAGQTVSVTVMHRDAATADAAATALFVAGPDEWTEVARRMGIRHVMLIDRDGVVHMNPAMQSRVRFETDTPEVRLSKPLS
jgi:thiamine biosynthesis lipoprotein